MSNDYHYLAEKFSILIHGLVVGEGNIRERLLENAVALYMVFGLTFPEHLENQKNDVIKQLTKFPPLIIEGEIIWSSYQRTIMKIRKKTAVRLVESVYDLKCDFMFYYQYELKKYNYE